MRLIAKWPLHWISLAGCLIYLTTMVHLNEVPVDAGDGLQHFATAQYSWHQPSLLLDHWAKPLFTLLSSPFAQGGFTVWLYFNLLIFLGTGIAGIRLLQRYSVHTLVQTLFPILLICIPDYIYCVLAGMTETLFGFMMVLAILLASRQQWLLFAILLSFAPFARSEGMLALLLGVAVLVLNGRLLYIPLLATGLVLYGFVGLLIDWPFMWYFTKDPYIGNGFYGSGPWNHYLISWALHFGKTTAVIAPIALVGWWLYLKRTADRRFLPLLLFATCLYLGILIAHSYFWAYGLKSSLGLTRLATLGIPSFLVLLLVGFNEAVTRLNPLLYKISLVFLAAVGVLMISRNHYPLKAGPMETAVIEATDYVKANESHFRKAYYLHPIVYWRLGINPFAKNPKYIQHFFNLEKDKTELLREGDIIMRDSQFGGGEQGLPLAKLDSVPRLYLARTFDAVGSNQSYLGEYEAMSIYKIHDSEYLPIPLRVSDDIRLNKRTFELHASDLYLDVNKQLKIGYSGTVNTIALTISWKTTSGKSPWIVLADGKTGELSDRPLLQNETLELELNAKSGGVYKLYFYNPDKAEGTIRITEARMTSILEPGL